MNLLAFHFCAEEAQLIAKLVGIPAFGYLWWRFRYVFGLVIDWFRCRLRISTKQ